MPNVPRVALVPRYRDLPLVWKLLVPYIALMLIVATAGTFVIVRDAATRAQTAVDQQLSRQLLDARLALHDEEVYLLESANFAANVKGIAAAVGHDDGVTVTRLLDSVRALKTSLTLLAATDRRGLGVREFVRTPRRTSGTGTDWSTYPAVAAALRSRDGASEAGVIHVASRHLLVVATPICSRVRSCRAVGVAIAGIDAADIAQSVHVIRGGGITLYDARGAILASAGTAAPYVPATGAGAPRTQDRIGGRDVESLYGPLDLQGRRMGELAVTVPTSGVLPSVHSAAQHLGWILFAAILGIVGIGVLLTRLILRQVRPLLDTHRRLGSGDLDARAPVRGRDELGELAAGVNRMAEQLQASVTTLESTVEQRTAEVRRLLKERTDFFAALSHEFRTPLAIIRTQSGLLADRIAREDAAAAAESARVVGDAATQALAIVNDVLEAARAESVGVDVARHPVDVGALLRQLAPTIDGLATGAGLTSALDVEETLPVIDGDERRLREIVLNLVDNAVKYTAAGGSVRVAAHASSGTIDVSVSDTGIGIPVDAQERLFEPFYRVTGNDTQRGQASSGLGLAYTKRLVDAHDGALSCSSVIGVGTTFTVSLPIAQQPTATTPRPRRAASTKTRASR